MSIAYRPAEPRDRDWIITNWEQSYQDSNTAGIIRMETWSALMKRECAGYLDRAYATTIVAYNPDATPGLADLHGFISGEPDEKPAMVYYVYVEQSMRRFGIARGLFGALGVDPSKMFTYLCSTPILAPSRELIRKVPLAKWVPVRSGPDYGARYSREARRQHEQRKTADQHQRRRR